MLGGGIKCRGGRRRRTDCWYPAPAPRSFCFVPPPHVATDLYRSNYYIPLREHCFSMPWAPSWLSSLMSRVEERSAKGRWVNGVLLAAAHTLLSSIFGRDLANSVFMNPGPSVPGTGDGSATRRRAGSKSGCNYTGDIAARDSLSRLPSTFNEE